MRVALYVEGSNRKVTRFTKRNHDNAEKNKDIIFCFKCFFLSYLYYFFWGFISYVWRSVTHGLDILLVHSWRQYANICGRRHTHLKLMQR